MSEESFENLEFTSDSNSLDPEEFIDIIHDPDVLYYYIKDAHNKAKQDFTIDAADKTEDVKIHAKVEVFQSAIQYVEAFGIYLLAYIKGRDSFLDDLIKTNPSEVEAFFEHLQDDQIDDWLDGNNIDEDYQTLLKTLFGYLYVDQDSVTRSDGKDITEEELREAITESTNAINHELNSVGEFYTTFHDIYNAVKHGNRALPQTENTFHISPSDGVDEPSADVELDMGLVLFVCKNHNGEPYLTALPIDYLLEHTLAIVEKTHRLFTHIKKVSHAAIKDERFDISFFTYSKTSTDTDEAPSDWIVGQHSSGIIILPRTEETAALLSEPYELTFAARLELDGDSLLIKTRKDDEVTDEYPISASIVQQGLFGLTPQPIMGLTINFIINDLDALQYYELLQLQNLLADDSLSGIEVVDEQSDHEFPVGTPDDFPLPELEEILTHERMEQVALLQTITQRRIPVPLNISEEQRDIIDDCIEADLTRDAAIDAVEKIDQLGTAREFTEIVVEKISPSKTVLETEYIDVLPGTVDIALTDDETGETYSDEFETVRLPTTITDATFDELVESLRTNPDTLDGLLNQIPRNIGAPVVTPRVYVRYRRGNPGFWYTKHELRIEVLDETAAAHPPIQCELCGESTTDIKQHLLENCSLLN